MKILCLSDSHGLHYKIPKQWFPKADVIIHAGDICNRGLLQEAKQFLDWFDTLDYPNKIYIAGNHDWIYQEHPDKVKELMLNYPSITYLQDSEAIIDGIKFYGSPWQPEFHQWAFNIQRGKLHEKWDKIPLDADVLITHGPPYGIGDFVPYNNGEYVGCRELLDTVSTQLTHLKAHICGHIHYSYGKVFKQNCQFINASTCNERYEPIQKPILIEI